MPNGQIDPARLEGEDLRRWYLRTPEETEQEKQLAAAKRYQDYFYGPQFRSASDAQSRAVAAPGRETKSQPSAGSGYGKLPAAPPADRELRWQEAEFDRTRREIADKNSWMAIPALGPVAAALGLEAGAAIAAGLASEVVRRGPLVLTERLPYLRVGDNWATRAGRRADKFYKDMGRPKDGWDVEPRVRGPNGTILKPDLGAPARTSDPRVRRYIEVKPDTPSGRAAAARQVKKYKEATRQNVRALFYDPKRFM